MFFVPVKLGELIWDHARRGVKGIWFWAKVSLGEETIGLLRVKMTIQTIKLDKQ